LAGGAALTILNLTNALLSALLAPPCATCGEVLTQPLHGAVCGRCWASIVPQVSSFSLKSVEAAYSVGHYEGTLRDAVHALKYEGRRSIAPRLSRLMATNGQAVLHGADLIVPVPLHWRRFRSRGFNQADDLACGLGLRVHHLLRRVRATTSQIELPAEERRTNVRGAFALRRSFGRRVLLDKTVVLVDDVLTTGATLEACTWVLYAAGAREVRALTAARVVMPGPIVLPR